MPSALKYLNDPKFHSLSKEARLKILAKEDPTFASKSSDVQNGILDKAAKDAEESKPGMLESFANGLGFDPRQEYKDITEHPIETILKKTSAPAMLAEQSVALPMAIANRFGKAKEAFNEPAPLVMGGKDPSLYARSARAGLKAIPMIGDMLDSVEERNFPKLAGQYTGMIGPELLSGAGALGNKIAKGRSEAVFNAKFGNRHEAKRLAPELLEGGRLSDVFGFGAGSFSDELGKKLNTLGAETSKNANAHGTLARLYDKKLTGEPAYQGLKEAEASVQTKNPYGGTATSDPDFINAIDDVRGEYDKFFTEPEKPMTEYEQAVSDFEGKDNKPKRVSAEFGDVHGLKQKEQRVASRMKMYGIQDPASSLKGEAHKTGAAGFRNELNEVADLVNNFHGEETGRELPSYEKTNKNYHDVSDVKELFDLGQGKEPSIIPGIAVGQLVPNPAYAMARGVGGAYEKLKSTPGVNLGLARSAKLLAKLTAKGMPLAEAQRLLTFMGSLNQEGN